MITAFQYPEQRAELEYFLEMNPEHYVWHDGERMVVYTGDDIPTDA